MHNRQSELKYIASHNDPIQREIDIIWTCLEALSLNLVEEENTDGQSLDKATILELKKKTAVLLSHLNYFKALTKPLPKEGMVFYSEEDFQPPDITKMLQLPLKYQLKLDLPSQLKPDLPNPIKQHQENNQSNQIAEKQQPNRRGPYRSYSIQEKQFIVDLYFSRKMSFASISKRLKIPQKNVVRWCRQGCVRKSGAGRRISDKAMEKSLLGEISMKYEEGEMIRVVDIQSKAIDLSSRPDFKASKGWFKNFTKRHHLESKYNFE